MNLLWDKKMKMNQQIKISNPNLTQQISILKKSEKQIPPSKREIQLLSGRLNKLFPSEKINNRKISTLNSGSKTTK